MPLAEVLANRATASMGSDEASPRGHVKRVSQEDPKTSPPLVLHIIHRLAVGGLENGLVNLINNIPIDRYRHAIVCLTDYAEFRQRICRADVPVIALHKRDGHDPSVYMRLWQVLRTLHPDIVHTRNLPTLEYIALAACAGVPCRIHSEHGRDVYDLDGSSFKYNLLRKGIRPFIHRYITVSVDLADWLIHTVRARAERVSQIYNGVDVQRFHPRIGPRSGFGPEGFCQSESVVIGTVGRMHAVKDQLTLVRAFLRFLNDEPQARQYCRLAMIGDGPLREEARCLLRAAHAEHLAWLPGERADIPETMRALDLFVLPSLAEGISNTVLEAMASGLPVIATRVGGNPELVAEGRTGMLVPPKDPNALVEAICTYLVDPEKMVHHGRAGRKKVAAHFSMESMVNGYLAVYDSVLAAKKRESGCKLWGCEGL